MCQDHYVTSNGLYLLSRDNDDTEELIIPTNFIPTKNSGYIAFEVQLKVKYGLKFSGCNILNDFGYLITRNQYDIKGSRYFNFHMQMLCCVDKCQSITL